MNLDLVTTDDLLYELGRRFDAMVFNGLREETGGTEFDAKRVSQGTVAQVLLLIKDLDVEVSTTLKNCKGPPQPNRII